MKKRLIALAVAVVVVLPFVGVANAADGPTVQQFRRLRNRVVQLETRVESLELAVKALQEGQPPPTTGTTCQSTIPVSQFDDYLSANVGTVTGLDLDTPSSAQWNVVIKTC